MQLYQTHTHTHIDPTLITQWLNQQERICRFSRLVPVPKKVSYWYHLGSPILLSHVQSGYTTTLQRPHYYVNTNYHLKHVENGKIPTKLGFEQNPNSIQRLTSSRQAPPPSSSTTRSRTRINKAKNVFSYLLE